MPTHIEWSVIALRLALTAIASAAIGVNRHELHRPVGLRTTMLVALSAAIAMIQVNLLLPIAGKPSGSFVMLDLMRLPLGALSGMGFIGAGAIVRRGDLVQGVTTAATLWYVTMMGLYFWRRPNRTRPRGVSLGLAVLWCLKWVERRYIDREHRAELVLAFESGATIEQRVTRQFVASGSPCIHVRPPSAFTAGFARCNTRSRWPAGRRVQNALDLAHELGGLPGVIRIEWRAIGRP